MSLQTCYAVSTRLVLWGDELNHRRLLEFAKVGELVVNTESKGERIQLSSGNTRTAKTGVLSFSFSNEANCFDPVDQLDAVSDILDRIGAEILDETGVERGELQLFVYYEKQNVVDAECDFLPPERLSAALAQTGIRLRITVMP